MIESLANALKTLVKKPFLLLPGLAAIEIALALLYVFSPFLIDLAFDVFLLGVVPEAPLNALPFQFASIYLWELAAMLVFSLLLGLLFISLNYWYAAFVRDSFEGNASIAKSCRETVAAFGKIIGLLVFLALVCFLFGFLLWLFIMLEAVIPFLGIILTALLFLAGIYLYIKLVFVVQALALEEGSVKQALQQAWEFSKKRFLPILLFVIVLSAVNHFLLLLGGYASDPIEDDMLAIVVIGLFWAVSLGFAGMAMPFYYAKKKLGKSI